MKRRNKRRLFLGIQWDSATWVDVPPLCEQIFRTLEGIPIHWNLPALPLVKTPRRLSPFITKLRDRIEANGDVVSSMGFAGACHPLLNLDELEKELAWGVSNQWRTGLLDAIGIRPVLLMPTLTDLSRMAALELYRRHGFQQVGFAEDGAFRVLRRDGTALFSFIRLPVREACRANIAYRMARGRVLAGRDVFLMLDLSGPASLESLRFATENIVAPFFSRGADPPKACAVSVLGKSPASASTQQREKEPRADWTLFPAPALRDRLEAATTLTRRKRKTREQYRRLLALLSTGSPCEESEGIAGKVPARDTLLVAHMLGEVLLSGSDFDAVLSGGRLCGIVRTGRIILPRTPVSSYLRIGGRTWRFRTRSSFSFEGDGCTGLREDLALDDSGRESFLIPWRALFSRMQRRAGASSGRAKPFPLAASSTLRIEYSFRDDSPMLSIGADLRYPVFEKGVMVDEHAPLEIPLLMLERGKEAMIESLAPDGSAARHIVRDGEGWNLVPGAAFRIRLTETEWLLLRTGSRSDPGGRHWGLFFFRVRRRAGGGMLVVNPFGSYAPVRSELLSGKRRIYRLLLGTQGDR